MSLLKKASPSLLAAFLLATTLPVSCTSPNTETPDVAAAGNTNNETKGLVLENRAAISGIVSIGRGSDGRLVPPSNTVLITVKAVSENNQEVARGRTDSRGRFYISNIPAAESGTTYIINIPGATPTDRQEVLFAGQVKDLSNIALQSTTGSSENLNPITVTGTLIDPTGNPRANVTVRDKNYDYLSTQTDANGQFVLEALSEVLEVVISDTIPPISFNSKDLENNPVLTIDSDNIRTIQGTIKDSTNSNISLENVVVRVSGRSTSTTTDRNGNYVLNGVPLGPVSLEVTPPNNGYAKTNVQLPPASLGADGKPESITRNINLRPIGTLQVNFTSESVKGINAYGCDTSYNCRRYDINPPFSSLSGDGDVVNDQSEPYYHNTLGVTEPLTATIRIEGTDISQTVTYPAAPLLTLRGTDRLGELVTLDEAVIDANPVFSVMFENVPGGAQNITISMTGHQTQKSIPVFIPPRDTISTERITLYRVTPVTAVGDVKGIIRGIDPDVTDDVRIAYIDVSEDLSIYPSAGETIGLELFDQLQQSLNDSSSNTVVNKTTGEYYLKNVPTGSRIMLIAASVDEDGVISDCYIPNASVLLNVRAGQINLAPDLTLTKRPNECN